MKLSQHASIPFLASTVLMVTNVYSVTTMLTSAAFFIKCTTARVTRRARAVLFANESPLHMLQQGDFGNSVSFPFGFCSSLRCTWFKLLAGPFFFKSRTARSTQCWLFRDCIKNLFAVGLLFLLSYDFSFGHQSSWVTGAFIGRLTVLLLCGYCNNCVKDGMFFQTKAGHINKYRIAVV